MLAGATGLQSYSEAAEPVGILFIRDVMEVKHESYQKLLSVQWGLSSVLTGRELFMTEKSVIFHFPHKKDNKSQILHPKRIILFYLNQTRISNLLYFHLVKYQIHSCTDSNDEFFFYVV